MLIPIVQGGLGYFKLVLDISSNVTEYNVLTAATAAGYNASTDVRPIVVNVASGVTVSGSTTHAMRTGVLNAATSLTVNINGSIDGYTGASGTAGVVGSVGGDAIYWETSGTSVVNVANGANLRSGGGGGGGGGNLGITQFYNGKDCFGSLLYGSYGGTGSAGGFGISGTQGGSGTYNAQQGPSGNCIIQAVGAGAAGGAAGFAIRENSNTITVNNSGTIAGTIG